MKSPKSGTAEESSLKQINKEHLPSVNTPQKSNLPFTLRVTNALIRAGITSIHKLCLFTVDLLLQYTYQLGTKGVAEIEEVLAQEGKALASTPPHNSDRFYTARHLIQAVEVEQLQELKRQELGLIVVAEAPPVSSISRPPQTIFAPIERDQEDTTQSALSADILLASLHALVDSIAALEWPLQESSTEPPAKAQEVLVEKLDLYQFWQRWLSKLTDVQQAILFGYYGLDGDEPITLQELGEELELTRERVRQLKLKALQKVSNDGKGKEIVALGRLFSGFIAQANGLLTVEEWERWCDEQTTWETDEPKPFLLRLLCDLFEGYSFEAAHQVVCIDAIGEQLNDLEQTIKRLLRQHKQGLVEDELVALLAVRLPVAPILAPMHEPAFILKAITLFERIGKGKDGRYRYLRKGQEVLLKDDVLVEEEKVDIWLGEPGTRLHTWECNLREQIKSVAWIGQLALSEEDFQELGLVIQEESQSPNYNTKEIDWQPDKVPSAIFITTMVFAARYSQQNADEFWVPYLQNVWNVEYTQAFMTRCRKRFRNATAELAQVFHLEFPGAADGELVGAVYRHALLPRYVQDDFAKWLRAKWQSLLALADSPILLINQVRGDRSLEHLPKRLRKFILDKETQETAADLIATMAAAIALHINRGESFEEIAALLADTPIKQELWREIAQEISRELGQQKRGVASSLRITPARVQWLWVLENDDIALHVQNIILPADSVLEGEPNRLVWVDSAESDPTEAMIEQEVSPWRMNSGERVIQEVLLTEPNGPLQGRLLLLTDMDEEAANLAIPPLPGAPIQFFRPLRQGAHGLPVESLQMDDGLWFVCAKEPLVFLDAEEEVIEPEVRLAVPYSLRGQYRWAAQVRLTLPVQIMQGGKGVLSLARQTHQSALADPLLTGAESILGLSSHIQPTFADRQLSLSIEYGGERLLKQASLWLHGEDGWRLNPPLPLVELVEKGQASLLGDALFIDLSKLLPANPNLYTLELRASLQPLFAAPLYFAVVPGLQIEMPSYDQPFTRVNPFEITLYGVEQEAVMLREEMSMSKRTSGGLVVRWSDLSKDPHLLLRFEKSEILLEWSVPRFSAWLEPKPTNSFLTLDELRETTLHAVSKELPSEEFALSVTGEGKRPYKLSRGRLRQPLRESQLYEVLRRAQSTHLEVNVQIGEAEWKLFEVRQRPDLSQARVEYDPQEKLIHLNTGLQKAWEGQSRFFAASNSNPYDPPVELGESAQLAPRHDLSVPLSSDQYCLRIELDGVPLLLNEGAMLFTIEDAAITDGDTRPSIVDRGGKPSNKGNDNDTDDITEGFTDVEGLIREIRSGHLISNERVEDFVLWWAHIQEHKKTKLTPVTLYQLAAVPPFALENFRPNDLRAFWPALADLRAVQEKEGWIDNHGCLPAWVLLPNPLVFITPRGFEWPIYPIQVSDGGLRGKGYGLFPVCGAKLQLYVQWHHVSATDVHIEVGIPDVPSDELAKLVWAEVELEDTYGLAYCQHCGQLVGAKGEFNPTKSVKLTEAHWHGRAMPDVQEINVPPEQGGYRLIGQMSQLRRGKSLLETLNEFGIIYPLLNDYLPMPNTASLLPSQSKARQMKNLCNAILAYGASSDESSPWASAARIVSEMSLNDFAQGMIALGLLMRTASTHQGRYARLLNDASLSEADVQGLLAEVEARSPAQLRWGLTWAELLIQHSPGSRYKTNR